MPIALTVLADWIENVIHLDLLAQYLAGGEAALRPALVQIASIATVTKLSLFAGSALLLFALCAALVFQKQ